MLKHLCVTVALNTLCVGIIIPTQVQLLTDMLGGNVSESSSIYGTVTAIAACIQFVMQPIIGALSDKLRTRKRIFLVQQILCVAFFSILSMQHLTLRWYWIAKIIQSCTALTPVMALSSISDITTQEERASAFGKLYMSMGMIILCCCNFFEAFGFTFGPGIGGFVSKRYGLQMAFAVAKYVCIASTLYLAYMVRDTAPKEATNKSLGELLAQANPLRAFQVFWKHGTFVFFLSIGIIFSSLATGGMTSIWSHYASFRYNFGSYENGMFLSCCGLGTAFVQGYLIKRVVKRYSEYNTVLFAISMDILCYALIGNYKL